MKYIVAMDGSTKSQDVVDFAASYAETNNAELDLVHTVTPDIYNEEGDVRVEDMSEAEKRITKVLETAYTKASKYNIDTDIEKLYGEPSEKLLEKVDENNYDCVFLCEELIMEQEKESMSNVASKLLRKSNISVTVVH